MAKPNIAKGSFGFVLEGDLVAPESPAGPVGVVGIWTFDGSGGLKGVDTRSYANGTVDSLTYTGTYASSAAYSGTITVPALSGAKINYVVVDGGKELLLLQTNKYKIATGNAKRV